MNDEILGKLVDKKTRCEHYNSELDIIAIKLKCCNKYYACFYCHIEMENHPPLIWAKDEYQTKAIKCGECKSEISISDYLSCGNACPICKSMFNPKCSNHYHYYFDL